ncbi:MAG: non-homologous end-joining DNA ligase [Candidatus Eremiobacteraeota bacterium]|nr:non-homologous end-joining DNA ligase [Candidatus Eremiobacteraeota bacterium]MCW5870547.1 non-homologous end-joining DNA ligase [Candidatus Eremiobacteraeota bacterium]
MSLQEYQKKRDFRKTKEPSGRAARASQGHRFVVQKHDASRLHYDFRLEEDGVLKSWAVPKGPSLDPGTKRLAVQVEDHPIDYGGFEGTIPKGEYGGGTVMLWDEGSWEPLDDPAQGWKKGHLHFRLHGEKLKGGWSLIRLKDAPNWLLIKDKDDFAEAELDITEQNLSVKTGRSMQDIAYHLEEVKPQLATLVKQAPGGQKWLHEIKYDGYRIIAYLGQGEVRLVTRGGLDWSDKFPSLVRTLGRLEVESAILDGEVVVLDEHGVSHFQKLQTYISNKRQGNPSLFLFDLLYLNGQDLRDLPLIQRKETLKKLPLADPLQYSDHILGQGPQVLEQACRLGCEGIISKEVDSPYVSRRTRSWVKVKCQQSQVFTIIGYTEPRGGRGYFGSLILAQDGKYAGKVGTGFTQKTLKSTFELFQEQDKPEVSTPRLAKSHWIKPELQARVGFSERTDEGILRHPVFFGLEKTRPSAKFRLTNADRVIDPATGITKGQLAAYYESVADRMLPYIADRPLSGLRCPDGLGGKCFYQKHRMQGLPRAVHSVMVDGEEYVSVNSVEGVLALVQMGVIEFHPWGSRQDDLGRPDRLVFDLDPDLGLGWPKVVEAAERVRKLLIEVGLQSFAKTTGGKGLHVVVPLERRCEWDEVKEYSRHLMEELVQRHKGEYTTNPLKVKRKGKMFLDYLRNGEGATSVAAYAVRARKGCPVSLPLDWEDVTTDLDPTRITLQDFHGLEERGRRAWQEFYRLHQRLRHEIS